MPLLLIENTFYGLTVKCGQSHKANLVDTENNSHLSTSFITLQNFVIQLGQKVMT